MGQSSIAAIFSFTVISADHRYNEAHGTAIIIWQVKYVNHLME
jgi:hypothetical protein